MFTGKFHQLAVHLLLDKPDMILVEHPLRSETYCGDPLRRPIAELQFRTPIGDPLRRPIAETH
ncbi:hypothetical protein ZOSMA_161G00290, partial [Zostera marina]